ncbi:MAG: acylneuraminate cytidylyltransferase family protein [Candidatus Rokubacteria bacterium]|nr:acylneuraminate cytidylyltransferase family protein [Candidatus Rokubacteria bacterium]
MILGVTPARGGSKGVPRKNVRPIHGRPLIAWTVEAAKASRLIDRYIVSTEDPEIAAVARSLDVEVFDRPRELADDLTTTVDVLRHMLTHVEANTVVLLQATSPIRSAGLIDHCIERFFETGADSLATGFMCKFVPYGKNTRRRQDLEGFFYDDGNVYVIRADILRAGDRYGTHLEHVLLEREQNVEIDDEFDFWLAEEVLKRRHGPI